MLLPIIFSINNNYVKQLATVIVSIVDKYSGSDILSFNILHKDISVENIKIISDMCSKFNNIEINFIDMKSYINEQMLENLMFRTDGYTYISTETWFRFFITDLFPQYDKVLYMDSDILVLSDISELYNTNIKNYYAGVVHDANIEALIKANKHQIKLIPNMTIKDYLKNVLHKKEKTYFNAGVILFNLKRMREDNISEKLWSYAKSASPLEYQDQDVLNVVLEGNVKFLNAKWNVLKYNVKIVNHSGIKVQKDVSIVHFVDSQKPWDGNFKYYNYKYVDEWWECYKKTPYFKADDLKTYEYIKEEQKALRPDINKNKTSVFSKIFYSNIENKHKVIHFLGLKLKIKHK